MGPLSMAREAAANACRRQSGNFPMGQGVAANPRAQIHIDDPAAAQRQKVPSPFTTVGVAVGMMTPGLTADATAQL